MVKIHFLGDKIESVYNYYIWLLPSWSYSPSAITYCVWITQNDLIVASSFGCHKHSCNYQLIENDVLCTNCFCFMNLHLILYFVSG